MLMIGGVELNPGLQTEEKLIEFMLEQREEMKGICQQLQKNKLILDTVSIKLDQMNDTTKIIMEEQERIKVQVNPWETNKAQEDGRRT